MNSFDQTPRVDILTSSPHYRSFMYRPPLCSVNLYKELMIYLLVLFLFACSSTPSPPPLPPQSKRLLPLQTEQLFAQGDWAALKKNIKTLPGEGPEAHWSFFLQAVLIGLEQPRRGLKRLKALRTYSSEELTQLNQIYQLIFQAQSGDCMLSEGPLRKLYWPKAKTLREGTRTLMQQSLKLCDESRAQLRERLPVSVPARSQSKNTSPSSTEDKASTDSSSADRSSSKSSKESSQTNEPSDQHNVTTIKIPKALTLTRQQRQSVTPHISFFILKKSKKIPKVAQLLLEIVPFIITQSEQRGMPLKIDVVEAQDLDELNEKFAELPNNTEAIIAFTQSKSLHKGMIEAIRTQARPLFLLSPFSVKTNKDELIWRLFATRLLIGRSLVKIGMESGTNRVGVVTESGRAGRRLIQRLKKLFKAQKIKDIHSLQIGQKESNWSAIAQEVRGWNIDTLVFNLRPTMIAQLTTHLAAQGTWSAQPSRFNKDLSKINQKLSDQTPKGKISDQYVRYLLWPTAYDQTLLNQAGRYVEGARLVTPVMRESSEFQKLNQLIKSEIGRPAELLDALFIDLIEMLDKGLRATSILKVPLLSILKEGVGPARFSHGLSFQHLDLIQSLHTLEVKQQRFVIYSPKEDPKQGVMEELQAKKSAEEPTKPKAKVKTKKGTEDPTPTKTKTKVKAKEEPTPTKTKAKAKKGTEDPTPTKTKTKKSAQERDKG